jgi:hypothetical protein
VDAAGAVDDGDDGSLGKPAEQRAPGFELLGPTVAVDETQPDVISEPSPQARVDLVAIAEVVDKAGVPGVGR